MHPHMRATVQPSASPLSESLTLRYAALRQSLRELAIESGGIVVAYSGGVDSALLLAVAAESVKVLNEERSPFDDIDTTQSRKLHQAQITALTAISPSYPTWERTPARELAMSLEVTHLELETEELSNPRYRANDGDRCFHCKTALFDVAEWASASEDYQLRGALVYGAITDDLGDHRPGMKAASNRGVRAPLIDTGFTKADVRALSRYLNLPTWDKPASACLSSRFPYGVEVTAARLDRVGRCESRLHSLGLKIVRARFHDDLVRLEFGQEELDRFYRDPSLRSQITAECKAVGFKFVSIDLEGYRSGSANDALVVIS